MRWRKRIHLVLRSLLLRKRVEAELEEELQFHLQRQMQESLAAGLTPAEAQGVARRALSGIEQ